jgi:hypothetical protein
MPGLTIDYAANPLTPYIRLTRRGNKYTLWVIVPLPIGYYLKADDNPQIEEDSKRDAVLVSIFVEGPEKPPTEEWYAVPLKIKLPGPGSNAPIRIDGNTPIKVTVYLDDPQDEGSSTLKYDDAEDDGPATTKNLDL